MLDKDAIKQTLTEENITAILIQLGSKYPIKDNHGNLVYTTVCHAGNKHKLYYYSSAKVFHCYTSCSCSFDIFELVIRANQTKGVILSFYEAVQFVASASGKWLFSKREALVNNGLIDDWNFINKMHAKHEFDGTLPIHSKNVLDVFVHEPHELWLNEGISVETMELFDIAYYVKDDRIVIPHYDIDGNLVGIRGRALREEDIADGKKYMPLYVEKTLYNHPTGLNLYGIHLTKHAIKKSKEAMLFESEKSVLKCQKYFGSKNNSVANCGSAVSEQQANLLFALGVTRIYIAFDKEYISALDEASIIKRNKYVDKLAQIGLIFQTRAEVFVLWDNDNLLGYKDSPADKGADVLEHMKKNATPLEDFMNSKDEIVIIEDVEDLSLPDLGDYSF